MLLRKIVLSLTLLLGINTALGASAELVPKSPAIGARAYLLMDFHSGRHLVTKNIDKPIEPASLTKLMTAYVTFYEITNGGIHLDDKVKISEKAWRMKGSRMFIEVNSKVDVKTLLKGMIIQSGNDASVALAEHVAGSEDAFVDLMNKHASNLGMKDTHFTNSTGWPHKNHYTTARDLATLTRALIRDFSDYYTWYSIKEFTYNDIRQFNRNRLLWMDERIDGVKTGHTDSAGYCLITSAKRGDMRLISIVLGTKSENSRTSASRKLINYGFRFYETFPLHAADEPLTNRRIWKGETDTLPLGLNRVLYITTLRGKRNKVKADMSVDAKIMAPVTKGKQYGTVDVKLGDKIIASRPLVALTDIAEGSLWQRMFDNVRLMFE